VTEVLPTNSLSSGLRSDLGRAGFWIFIRRETRYNFGTIKREKKWLAGS